MKELIANNFVPIAGILIMFAFVAKQKNLSAIRKRFFYMTILAFALELFFRNADYITSGYEIYTVRRAVYSALGYCSRSFLLYAIIGTDLNLDRKSTRKVYTLLGIPLLFATFFAVSVFSRTDGTVSLRQTIFRRDRTAG